MKIKIKHMSCFHCNNQLIWGGDNSYEHYGLEGEGIVTNLSCSGCEAAVLVYLPIPVGQSDSDDPQSPQSTETPLNYH